MKYALAVVILALGACTTQTVKKTPLTYRQVVSILMQPPHRTEVERCTGPVTAEKPQVSGDVHVSFYVNSDGRALKAGVVKNSTGALELSDCVLNCLRSWEFPSSNESTMYAVFYKFGPGGLQIRFPYMPEQK